MQHKSTCFKDGSECGHTVKFTLMQIHLRIKMQPVLLTLKSSLHCHPKRSDWDCSFYASHIEDDYAKLPEESAI